MYPYFSLAVDCISFDFVWFFSSVILLVFTYNIFFSCLSVLFLVFKSLILFFCYGFVLLLVFFLLSLFLVLQVTRAHGDTALKTVADR